MLPLFNRKLLLRNLLNIPGWKTERRIVVIESDDWGSIRMASKEAYQFFLKSGYPVDQCSYNKNDALESNEDLEKLFEVLISVKDRNGNPAVFTANTVVANPDFEKIKSSGYLEYYYEPFNETFKKYPAHNKVFDLYKEGIKNKIFYPQFHGREHLNVSRWMNALRRGDQDTHLAFSRNMFSVHTLPKRDNRNEFMDAMGYDSLVERGELNEVISEGLSLFNEKLGYKSKSFIASCYIWDSGIEPLLLKSGVFFIQGVAVQCVPKLNGSFGYKKKYHYQGQSNSIGQHYLVRNSFFEPNDFIDFNWIDDCLNRISVAFRWNKPAIISSHRKNYIGFINPANRDKNLQLLGTLLTNILQKWPDVEFMTSDQLGDLISGNKL
ncbi:MAG: hypothetical protein P4L27_09030 [Ignavibacteriaceae bacterium]|nr:hypothetical protein [Ignavibacteriaceae bacterium]